MHASASRKRQQSLSLITHSSQCSIPRSRLFPLHILLVHPLPHAPSLSHNFSVMCFPLHRQPLSLVMNTPFIDSVRIINPTPYPSNTACRIKLSQHQPPKHQHPHESHSPSTTTTSLPHFNPYYRHSPYSPPQHQLHELKTTCTRFRKILRLQLTTAIFRRRCATAETCRSGRTWRI